MSRSEGTRETPEAPDEAFTKRSSIQQNSEHKSQDEQNSTSDTITDQSPIANQPVLPLVVDVVKTLSSTSTSNADTPFVPPLPPNGENEKTNGASRDQSSTQSSGVKDAPANPEGTPLKAEPSPNRTMLLTALVAIVGVGIALYIFNPQVRKFVFSHYVRIFSKAPPQSTSYGTFSQTQQASYASAQGYARVNDPKGVAFF